MNPEKNTSYAVPMAIIIAGIILSATTLYSSKSTPAKTQVLAQDARVSALEEAVLPSAGIILPVTWGDMGQQLVSAGAIDAVRFKQLYLDGGTFSDEYKNLLTGTQSGKLKITRENSGYLLNLFWALGLANKNPVLDAGEMKNPAYGGAENFASTAGWTMAKGDAMNHYSKHVFFTLTPQQQALVDKVSRGIYRPCCGNSTHFPDCNHGMAMLGLLELMASQGASEQDIWKATLAVNSYWFPDTYLTIAAYMQNKGITWKEIPPQEVLGSSYSSAQGYASIAAQIVQPQGQQGGGGCGVDAGVHQTQQQSGCAI